MMFAETWQAVMLAPYDAAPYAGTLDRAGRAPPASSVPSKSAAHR